MFLGFILLVAMELNILIIEFHFIYLFFLISKEVDFTEKINSKRMVFCYIVREQC